MDLHCIFHFGSQKFRVEFWKAFACEVNKGAPKAVQEIKSITMEPLLRYIFAYTYQSQKYACCVFDYSSKKQKHFA